MATETTKKMRRTFKGTVVKDAMDKTVVVRVDRVKVHPKYQKRYTVSKRYMAHDEKNAYHVGDVVMMQETRPYSKHKKWRVTGLVTEKK